MGLFRRRFTRAAKIRTAIFTTIGLLVTGAWIYSRFVMPKEPLAGPCKWSIQCGKDAPTCMREAENTTGVCSRMCDAGIDCAEGIQCLTVETDERDDRQMPIMAGYCFPDSFPGARRRRRAADAGAATAVPSGSHTGRSPDSKPRKP